MIRLHGYWRSSAAYRVRITLGLKGLEFEQITYDLRQGEQRRADYLTLAPHGLVPALEADGVTLIESPAILEWLEEQYPTPALLPASAPDRAIVRAMAALIGCDIHPLNNLRVVKSLREDFAATPDQIDHWIAHWITTGFTALETLIVRHGQSFAFGDVPTLADCFLVPQVYAALRFKVDLAPFPRIAAAAARANLIPVVAAAHPTKQPDSDPA